MLRASTDCAHVVFLLRLHSLLFVTDLSLFICWEEDPTPFHRGVIDGTFLSMVRSVSLIVLCIFAKRFVLSVSGFLSQRNFCTTAVLLWGTHWGAVSWIVLFFSCRAIPRARFGPSELG